MGKTAAAGVGDLVSAHGAFVAGGFDNLDDISVVYVSAHGKLDSLA